MKHSTEIRKTIQKDGDTNAIVVRIPDTGDSSMVTTDRYKHTIYHNLGRVPVGCQIIMSDKIINMYVIDKDTNKIIVKFNNDRTDVNLRIW